MATTATANTSEIELEEGQPGPDRPRRIGYVRDITYKIIPFCALFLIIFSAGAILLATLAHNEPIPHQGTVVISILLLVFLLLFCVGSGYLYIKKRYPPLTRGPNAPDRPPPDNESFLTLVERIHTMLTDIHKRPHHRKEPGAENNPAELEGHHQTPDSRPPRAHRTNGQPSDTTRNRAHRNVSSRKPVPSAAASDIPVRSHSVGPGQSPLRHPWTPDEPPIIERPESNEYLGPPDSIPNDMDSRTSRQDLHTRVGVVTYLSQLLTIRRVEAILTSIEMW